MLPTVVRLLVLALFLAATNAAQSLDDALASLGRRVAVLVAGHNLEFTHQNYSSLQPAEAQRVRSQFEKLLRRRQRSDAPVAPVTLTVSENRASYLLIAEVRPPGAYQVLIEPFELAKPARTPRVSLSSRLLWEEDEPILDVAVLPDRLFVLTCKGVFEQVMKEGNWSPGASFPIPSPPSRDPRGRLFVDEASISVHLPGVTCHASRSLLSGAQCRAGSEPFSIDGVPVSWTEGANTLETEGWPKFMQLARVGDRFVLSSSEGPALSFENAPGSAGVIEKFPSDDFASVHAPCAGRHLAALRDASSLQLFQLSGLRLHEASEAINLPGPVYSLWPLAEGVLALVRDSAASKYAAYQITVSCRP